MCTNFGPRRVNAGEMSVDVMSSPEGKYVQFMAEAGMPDFFFMYGKSVKEVHSAATQAATGVNCD